MPKDAPWFLQFLAQELGYAVRPLPSTLGYALYALDLSTWKLRFSNRVPVVWVPASQLESTTFLALDESLADVVRERNIRRDPLIVLLETEYSTPRTGRANIGTRFIWIDRAAQLQIRHSKRPTGDLLDVICAQIPISHLAPYETSSPVTGSRFFGRSSEMGRLLDNPTTNYLVLGIRRIGKTSLLQETERILREEQSQPDVSQTYYLDCSDLMSSEEFIREIVRFFHANELPRLHLQSYSFFFPNFLERMAQMHKGRLTLFLDEIDNLVLMQRGSWEVFRMLRAAANKGACRCIIAGYSEAMKEQALLNSPFHNFTQEMRLDEFSKQDAHELIIEPMEKLRIRFQQREQIVDRIYQETSGQPNLIQYYCLLLLRAMDQRGDREISLASLDGIYEDEGFKQRLLMTFMHNTGKREKLMVYSLLRKLESRELRGFSQPFMDAALRKHGITLTADAIEEACQILLLAGILRRRHKEYFFTSPVFVQMLQANYDLDYLINKLKEEGF